MSDFTDEELFIRYFQGQPAKLNPGAYGTDAEIAGWLSDHAAGMADAMVAAHRKRYPIAQSVICGICGLNHHVEDCPSARRDS